MSSSSATGLASVVTGALFLVAMFVGPLAAVVPPEATASALVVVGFLGAGVIAHVVLALFAGRARSVHALVWGVAAAFAAYFALS